MEDQDQKPEQEKSKQKQGKLEVKTPKGTRDYGPDETKIREEVMSTIVKVFKQHGAVSIETPVMELKEVLVGKYGEDEKLIFDLADQGGELCALRYDLTVPFSRYVAQNNIKQIKKYQIGRVYRRDLPHMTRGRCREFYQCDFDIAGSEFGHMLPDAECLVVMKDILKNLDIGTFTIKINHRLLLDGIFAVCGVPAELFLPICSAVDKLDKSPWLEVRAEMTMKGLAEQAADKVGKYLVMKGHPSELIKQLQADELLMANSAAATAVSDLNKLFTYLRSMRTENYLSFDLSLARGLSYYTGVIFEAVLTSELNVGSVGGGGRYDKLVGRFKKKGGDVPCVGFSMGVERLFSVIEAMRKSKDQFTKSNTLVLVCTPETTEEMLEARLLLVSELWESGIPAEILLKDKPKLQAQLKYADDNRIPYAAIIGSDELAKGQVTFKDLVNKDPATGKGEQKTVARAELIQILKEKKSLIAN